MERENPYQNEFKNPGLLEAYKGIKPLEATKITQDARERLEARGLTHKEIEDIRYFTSQFRYGLCAEKAERFSQIPAELFTRGEQEYINLPKFFDINGRLDGQCGDIGRQWIIQMNKSGLIKKLNQGKEYQIVTSLYYGLSETHFCKELFHVWNGLALRDQDGNIIDEIYIDAAFQKIHSKTETKYKPKIEIFNSRKINSTENIEIPIGQVEINGNRFKARPQGAAVLGVSPNSEVAYALSFLQTTTDKIKPMLSVIYKDESDDLYVIGNEEDEILTTNSDTTLSEHEEEIEKMLREAQKIEFVKVEKPTENIVTWEL